MSAIAEKALLKARNAFFQNVTKDPKFRIKQLKQLLKCLDENTEEIVAVLKADLNKPALESIIMEVDFVRKDIQYQLDNISNYLKPEYVPRKGLSNFFDSCYVKYDPYGVVLIFGAWNYPFQLVMCPLIGAIVAGNCAIVKPSELAPKTEKLLAKLVPKYLDPECFHVICGGPDECTQLLTERFDMVFYTGSTNVGKLVYQACAKHLTPVVLELGGKSPVYIDQTVNMEFAVKRILWGKFTNAGQTCIAPDYILCTADVQEKFIKMAEKIIKNFFDTDPKKSESFGRIVNHRNFDRLKNSLDSSSGTIVIGGETDRDNKYISPTLVKDVTMTDSLMKDEIFGPILPIVIVDNVDEAIEHIKRGEKPLTMYIFSSNKDVQKRFQEELSSGSIVMNDTFMHMIVDELPFGGVGYSGMGNYHGQYSFKAFSHAKSIVAKDFNPLLEFAANSRYPPFSDKKLKLMSALVQRTFIDKIDFVNAFSYILTFLLGLSSAILYFTLK